MVGRPRSSLPCTVGLGWGRDVAAPRRGHADASVVDSHRSVPVSVVRSQRNGVVLKGLAEIEPIFSLKPRRPDPYERASHAPLLWDLITDG